MTRIELLRNGVAASATALIVAPVAAHGDHGPGGHDGWDLYHFHLGHWAVADWVILASLVLVLAVVGGAALTRRRRARRRLRR